MAVGLRINVCVQNSTSVQWQIRGGGRLLPPIDWMHLKMVKILHKMHHFRLKFEFFFKPHPLPFRSPIPKFWIRRCQCSTICFLAITNNLLTVSGLMCPAVA